MKASSIDATCVAITTVTAVVAIGRDPAQWGKKKYRDLTGKSHRPQQQRRTRQPIDQPRLRHALHPGADQRDQLAAEEELEVAMTQRPPRDLPA